MFLINYGNKQAFVDGNAHESKWGWGHQQSRYLYFMCTSVSWQAIHQQAIWESERYLEQYATVNATHIHIFNG